MISLISRERHIAQTLRLTNDGASENTRCWDQMACWIGYADLMHIECRSWFQGQSSDTLYEYELKRTG